MKNDDLVRTCEQIRNHEGFSSSPYKDTEGVITFGHGLTYITEDESKYCVEQRVHKNYTFFESVSWFKSLNPPRKAVVINMAYNLGLGRFRGFKRMIAALWLQDFELVVKEMLDSKWSRQVKGRAESLAIQMYDGEWY